MPFYGCTSPRTADQGRGIYRIDRVSGAVTQELDIDVASHALRKFGDVLAVNAGATDGVWIGDIDSGQWRQVTGLNKHPYVRFARQDDDLLVMDRDGLHRVSLDTLAVTWLGKPPFNASKSLDLIGPTTVAGENGTGKVWTYNWTDDTSQIIDLTEFGAGAQAGMSVGASQGYAYVAGNNAVGYHDLAEETLTKLSISGEAKEMTAVDGVMYLATYPNGQIWQHRLDGNMPPQQMVELDYSNRPQAVQWDAQRQLLWIGLRADAAGSGSLAWVDPVPDPESGTWQWHEYPQPLDAGLIDDPTDEDRKLWQNVMGLAVGTDHIYLGGVNRNDLSIPGKVAAWDPVAEQIAWQFQLPTRDQNDPQQRFRGISSLVTMGRYLYGTTMLDGRFFVIDLESDEHEIVHEEYLGPMAQNHPKLIIDRGLIIGVSQNAVFTIEPESPYRHRVLVDGLEGDWHGPTSIKADEEHNLYTLWRRNLIRISGREVARAVGGRGGLTRGW